MLAICYRRSQHLAFSLCLCFFNIILSVVLIPLKNLVCSNLLLCLQRTPISHKVIEKRRRDRINRCLNELGKTVPMALAKQVFSTLEIIFGVKYDTLLEVSYYKISPHSHLNTMQRLEQIL